MANYSTLKAAVADVVKTNGEQTITGANLQAVLLSVINSVGGGGFIFKGIATPSTDAGTPDENVFYVGGAGTYANFGAENYTVSDGSIGVFKYNGTWTMGAIKVVSSRCANSLIDCYLTSQITINTVSGVMAYTDGYVFIGNDTPRRITTGNADFSQLTGLLYIAYSLSENQLYVVSYITPLTSANDMVVGAIDKSNNSAVVNCRKLTINGSTIVSYTEEERGELGEIVELTPVPEEITTPTSDWSTKTFNNHAGTDGIFWDIRNRIGPARRIKKIYVKSSAAGTMRIHFLSLGGESLYHQDYSVVNGVTEINPPNLAYSQEMYVGAQNVTSQLMLVYPSDGTGQSRKKLISDNTIVEQTFPYALWLDVVNSENTLPYRVGVLESSQGAGINTLEELKVAVASGSPRIELNECDITLDEPLILQTGTKLTGVRGRSILRVPSGVLKGIELSNVTDIEISNITLIGAYNGTPVKSGLQPVRSGIVDTDAEARIFDNAGYQTDLANGGVTATYVPQLGINIKQCEKVEIIGCEIKNFSYYGIANSLSGKNYRYACKFENNYINNCYCGLYLYKEAERSQYIANNVSLCQIGLYLDSGTNMFTDNAFTANRIGMYMGNGVNHAHGIHTGDAFTHCSLFSIYAYNIENGEVFTQCKCGYVDAEAGNNQGYAVHMKNSRGLFFNNCQMIQCNLVFDGKFRLAYSSYSTGQTDQFGNSNYVVEYTDIDGQPSQYNGGVNQLLGCSFISGGGNIAISSDLDNTNVILKENYYITGQSSAGLNN